MENFKGVTVNFWAVYIHYGKLESLADVQNELEKAQNEADHLKSVTKNDKDLIDGLQVTTVFFSEKKVSESRHYFIFH